MTMSRYQKVWPFSFLTDSLKNRNGPGLLRLFSLHTHADGNHLSKTSAEELSKQAEALFRTHGDAVFRCAYSYLHNASDAEDVLQETLIRYMKTAPILESEAHEKAWLLRVAANLCKNSVSYRQRHGTDELSDLFAEESREDLAFVWDAVKSLPVRYRETIHLYYYEGYSTKEISKLLDRKESTVRSELRRGRERLKAVLKEDYDFD